MFFVFCILGVEVGWSGGVEDEMVKMLFDLVGMHVAGGGIRKNVIYFLCLGAACW